MARAGSWVRDEVHGQVLEEPTPRRQALSTFLLDVEDVPAAGLRPRVLVEPRPQVQRHRVGHIVDLVRVAPMVQILDAPVPQMRRPNPRVEDSSGANRAVRRLMFQQSKSYSCTTKGRFHSAVLEQSC